MDPVNSQLVVYKSFSIAEAKAYMQKMQDFFLRRSFQAQVADYQNFRRSWSGSVIVLVGGSSAGKSTIVNALKSFDKGMMEEGSDLTGANFIYEYMKKNHERFGVSNEEWEQLHSVLVARNNHWHIHEAVSLEMEANVDAYDFNPGVSVVDQERAMRTAKALNGPVCEFAKRTSKMVDNIVMDKVLEHAKKGQNIVFDLLDVDKVIDHPISEHAYIKSILVYCPFGKLAERLAERNRKAFSGEIDLSEVRAGVFPMLQYSELVRARQLSDHDKDVIDIVTRERVENDFNAAFNAGIEVMKRTLDGQKKLARMRDEPGGLSAKREREKQILLSAFGFTEKDALEKSIELVARKKYDLLIDTSDPTLGNTPVERGNTAAKRILKF
jgi:hypothetical protein